MEMQITFHQMQPSEAIKEYCHSKLDKLTRYYQKIEAFKIVFDVNKHMHHVSAVLHLPGKTFKAEAEARDDIYAAIDAMHDKLERLLTDYKEKH